MLRLKSTALLIGFVASCGQAGIGSQVKAIVTPEQLEKSREVLADMLSAEKGYLPFEYKRDGCYALALYMAMALAAEGVPSSAVFAFKKPGGKPLTLSDGTAWRYHVAPMVKVGETGDETILDPGMGPERYFRLTEWLDHMQVKENDIRLFRVQGSRYAEDVVREWQNDKLHDDPLIREFSQLSAFKSGQIEKACRRMHAYLAQHRDEGRGKQARRQTLYSETVRLVQALEARGKFEQTTPSTALDCGGAGVDFRSGAITPKPVYSMGVKEVRCRIKGLAGVPSEVSTFSVTIQGNEALVRYDLQLLFLATLPSPTYKVDVKEMEPYRREIEDESLDGPRLADFFNNVLRPQTRWFWGIESCSSP